MDRMIQEALQGSGKPNAEYFRKQYKLHFQRTLVQVGASLVMWFFALAAYVFDLIAHHHLFGVSLVVLYLIAINPPKLWILKRIQGGDHLVRFLLFINFLEIIGYTAVIYFMGGIEATYLTVLYATVIASVGSVSKRQNTFLVAGICAAAYNAMVLLEGTGLIPWYKVIPNFDLPWSHRMARMFVVDGLLLVIAYITSYTTILLRKAKGDLKASYGVLEQRVAERTNELRKVNKKLILDINQRKAIEKKLESSEKRYRALFENAEDAIFILDASPEKMGQIVDANQSAAIMHGYTIEELKGLNIKNLDAQHDADKVEERVLSILEGEWIKNEINHVRNDGSIFPVEISAGLLEIENNQYIIAIDRDIEERKKIETRLRKSEKMEAIGTLAGGIAHDFNNILSAILGYTELAKMEIPKESPATQSLDQVYQAGHRAKDLVRQILTVARQSDNVMIQLSVASITKEALKLMRASLPSTIEIKQEIESESLIIGDSTQIHQIIMNLCTNAAHAMEEKGGALEVSLSDTDVSSKPKNKTLNLKPGNYIKLVVSDDGAGIPDDVIKSIFEPYFTTKKTGKGTGLGLAIVHGIVEAHGGEITVDTVLENGTKFTVYLPISQNTKKDLSKNKEEIVKGNEHILLVDDEAAIVEIHKQFLEAIGYSVSTRMNGMEALELFQAESNKFDLVITDMTMPKMTGDALATKLRAIKPDIPIIICTGYSKKMSNEVAAKIGINAVCYKPLSMKDLAKTIRKVLDN